MTWRRPFAAHDAELCNWRREWKHCVQLDSDGICALTVSPSTGERVQGVLILCSLDELRHVDERELGYLREAVPLGDVCCSIESWPRSVFVYRSKQECYRQGSREMPIWWSYLECVLFGYLKKFGKPGVDRFVASTSGWATPVLDDRARPRYPRAHDIPKEERSFLDNAIARIEGLQSFKP
jgi:hypothetical protein